MKVVILIYCKLIHIKKYFQVLFKNGLLYAKTIMSRLKAYILHKHLKILNYERIYTMGKFPVD